jgi:hypothetical protein
MIVSLIIVVAVFMSLKLLADFQRVIKYFEKKFHFLKEKVAIFETLILSLQRS